MADQIIGEIRAFAFDFTPAGWAPCRGQLLPINQNQALFSLLGTLYGGDGRTSFALPDLRGRVAIGEGTAASGSAFGVGEPGGEETHQLTQDELPRHRHRARASAIAGTTSAPANSVWAAGQARYAPHGTATMAAEAIAQTGGDAPHNTMQPYLPLNYCIAVVGDFPTRS